MNKIRLLVAMLFSITVAACGGGGGDSSAPPPGGTSAADTAVGSLLASNGVGGWYGSTLGASAYLEIFSPTGTENTYTSTYVNKQLVSGVWTTPTQNPGFDSYYRLGPNGWVDMTNNVETLLDSGDGSHVTFADLALAEEFTITQTSLSGAIACNNSTGQPVACTAPGNYPAGAAEFSSTATAAFESYSITSVPGREVTNVQGGLLTALPAVGDTFCDPLGNNVYQPITPTPAAGADNYNVISAASCSATDIATALGGGLVSATTLISIKATGNSVVPNVLHLNTTSGYSWIYGLRAGAVWGGSLFITPTIPKNWGKNKVAINAELTANGLPVLP